MDYDLDFSKDDTGSGFQFSESAKYRKRPPVGQMFAGGESRKVGKFEIGDDSLGWANSPRTEDSIPSLLELPPTRTTAAAAAASGGGNDYRPPDPLGDKLTPQEVYTGLPENVRSLLEQMKSAGGVGNSEQTGRLRYHLNSLMGEGKNPFPVIRLYKEFLGTEQLGRVVNSGMISKLDYFWEHWQLPPQGTSAAGNIVRSKQQTGNTPWLKLEKLTGKGGPKVFLDDPTQYKPSDIDGVCRDSVTGRYVATYSTIKWIRSIAFSLHRSGKQDKYEPFLDTMRGYFGADPVEKAISTSAQTARLERASARYAAEEKDDNGKFISFDFDDTRTQLPQGSRDQTDAETDELSWIMHNMTRAHIPGITGVENRSGFSSISSKWIQDKMERMLACCLNPDPFLQKLFDMFGDEIMRQLFTTHFSRRLAAGIRNLPTGVTEPKFLIKIIRETGVDTPNRQTGPFAESSRPGRPTLIDYPPPPTDTFSGIGKGSSAPYTSELRTVGSPRPLMPRSPYLPGPRPLFPASRGQPADPTRFIGIHMRPRGPKSRKF